MLIAVIPVRSQVRLDKRRRVESGFRDARFERSARTKSGAFESQIWTIQEILTASALSDEGRQMHHCVYWYAGAIEQGQTSIWSMRLDECGVSHRCVTIEVRNHERLIVQAGGRFNRPIRPIEVHILAQWAAANGLKLRI